MASDIASVKENATLIGQVFRFGLIKRVDAILPQIDQDVVISLQLAATHDRWFEEPVAWHAFPR
jgi:hypothetical protein